jgi:hypothetical protein
MYFGIYCVYYVYCVSLPPKPRLPCGFTETLPGVTAPFPEMHCRPCSAVPLYCGNVCCLRCSSVSVIAFGSTHATTAEHSRVCTVLQLDRSSGCSGSQWQISDGVSTLSCGRLPGNRKDISLALQNAGKDFGTSPAPEIQRKLKTNAYTIFVVSEVVSNTFAGHLNMVVTVSFS